MSLQPLVSLIIDRDEEDVLINETTGVEPNKNRC